MQHRRLPERPPQHLGTPKPRTRRREGTAQFEQPAGSVRVSGSEVDGQAEVPDGHAGLDVAEPAGLEDGLGDVESLGPPLSPFRCHPQVDDSRLYGRRSPRPPLGRSPTTPLPGCCRTLVKPGLFLVDALAGPGHVALVGVVAEVVASGAHRGDRGGAGADERVEDDVADVGVEVDEACGQLDGEGGGVSDPAGVTRRGMSHTSRVDSKNRSLVVVFSEGSPTLAFLAGHGPVEAALAGHDDPFGDVAQHRVGRRWKEPPAQDRPALGFPPDDLAPQEQAQVVLEDPDDVG